MQRKNKTHIRIRTNSGRLAWCGYIYPMTVCGSRHYNSSFRLAEEKGCLATDSNHKVAGGRDQSVIEVPDGYELLQLTKPQVSSLIEQLPDDGQQWWTSDTYYKVNAESYSIHNTVEFRQHSGTIEIEKMENWIRFLDSLVKYSEYGVVENNDFEIRRCFPTESYRNNGFPTGFLQKMAKKYKKKDKNALFPKTVILCPTVSYSPTEVIIN